MNFTLKKNYNITTRKVKSFIFIVVLMAQVTAAFPQEAKIDSSSILKKCISAFAQVKSLKEDMMMNYTVTSSQFNYVVYQKQDKDSNQIMRIDTKLSTMLFLPQGIFQVRGTNVLNMSILPKESLTPFTSLKISEIIKILSPDLYIGATVTNGVVDGKNCWVISRDTNTQLLEDVNFIKKRSRDSDLNVQLPGVSGEFMLAAKYTVSIDKKTFLMIKNESFDIKNNSVSYTLFRNINTNIDLPDQLFKLP